MICYGWLTVAWVYYPVQCTYYVSNGMTFVTMEMIYHT